MGGFGDFIRKSFNLGMIENGCYRPRIGAFMLEYLDIMLWKTFNLSRGGAGGHLPLVLLVIPVMIAGWNGILKNLSDTMSWQCRFLTGAGFLFSTHYQAATYVFLRTAKLLAPAVVLCVAAFFLSGKTRPCNLKKDLFTGFVFSLIYTIDEQILAAGMLFCAVSIVYGCCCKRLTTSGAVFFSSGVFYVVYYFTWGRMLFAHFTEGELLEHPHTYHGMLENLQYSIAGGSRVYFHAMLWMAWNSIPVLVLCAAVYLIFFFLNRDLQQRLLSLSFLAGAYGLAVCMVSAHPAIAVFEDIPRGMYFITTAFLTVTAFFITGIPVSEKVRKELFANILAVICLLNFCYVWFHIDMISSNHTVQGMLTKEQYQSMLENEILKENGICDSYFDGLRKWSE